MKILPLTLASFGLAACGDGGGTTEVGRYAYHAPTGEMPAVLIDTATGCVEVFNKMTSVDNPQDVDWVRSYADGTFPRVTYKDGKPVIVEGTAPPSRCPKQEVVKK